MSTLSGAIFSFEAAGALWALLSEITGIEGIESIIADDLVVGDCCAFIQG
jgi:hypothetical protein